MSLGKAGLSMADHLRTQWYVKYIFCMLVRVSHRMMVFYLLIRPRGAALATE